MVPNRPIIIDGSCVDVMCSSISKNADISFYCKNSDEFAGFSWYQFNTEQ